MDKPVIRWQGWGEMEVESLTPTSPARPRRDLGKTASGDGLCRAAHCDPR